MADDREEQAVGSKWISMDVRDEGHHNTLTEVQVEVPPCEDLGEQLHRAVHGLALLMNVEIPAYDGPTAVPVAAFEVHHISDAGVKAMTAIRDAVAQSRIAATTPEEVANAVTRLLDRSEKRRLWLLKIIAAAQPLLTPGSRDEEVAQVAELLRKMPEGFDPEGAGTEAFGKAWNEICELLAWTRPVAGGGVVDQIRWLTSAYNDKASAYDNTSHSVKEFRERLAGVLYPESTPSDVDLLDEAEHQLRLVREYESMRAELIRALYPSGAVGEATNQQLVETVQEIRASYKAGDVLRGNLAKVLGFDHGLIANDDLVNAVRTLTQTEDDAEKALRDHLLEVGALLKVTTSGAGLAEDVVAATRDLVVRAGISWVQPDVLADAKAAYAVARLAGEDVDARASSGDTSIDPAQFAAFKRAAMNLGDVLANLDGVEVG